VDEAVQFLQHVVRDVARSARLPVQEDRDVRVAEADLADETAQLRDRVLGEFRRAELLVVDRQDEGTCARLLLGEPGHVAVARHPEHLRAFFLDRLGERADAQPARVLRAEILVDDDDRKMELHVTPLRPASRRKRALSME